MAENKKDTKQKIPSPPADARAKTILWKAKVPIERIHPVQFSGAQFNPGSGNARFSPLKNNKGHSVSTVYGGENIEVAIMETLLHDLATPCAGLPVDMAKIDGLVRSQILPTKDLNLIDLNPKLLRKLGIKQAELLLSEAENYMNTQQWASKLYQDNPEAQGLQWQSKQHGGKAVMLFGNRIEDSDLNVMIQSEPAATSQEVISALKNLAEEMELVLMR